MNNPIALDDATDEHFMRRALELAKKGTEGAMKDEPHGWLRDSER